MSTNEHKPGCEALGGYGHGTGPCSCGAMSTSRELPPPDTHCFDEDTKRDVWSYSPELVRTMLEAATADTARKCVEVCEANEAEFWKRYDKGPNRGSSYIEGKADAANECGAAIRSAFPAAFNQEQSK